MDTHRQQELYFTHICLHSESFTQVEKNCFREKICRTSLTAIVERAIFASSLHAREKKSTLNYLLYLL